jgi:lipoprotein-anchoring transpeptidase ErfK/SrfK
MNTMTADTMASSSDGSRRYMLAATAIVLSVAALWATDVRAQTLAIMSGQNPVSRPVTFAPDQSTASTDDTEILPPNLRRQIVDYPTNEVAGTIVVDTPHTYLFFVLGNGQAIRYGIGIGREGFTWAGTKTIDRKTEWPDWIPPAEMLERQPYLPRFMAGGPGNPLGARAMYLSGTVYRIHGTNAPDTIGTQVSSGCIRMVNADVIDLYRRIHIGTKVVVLPMSPDVIVRAPGARHVASSMNVATKRIRTSSL